MESQSNIHIITGHVITHNYKVAMQCQKQTFYAQYRMYRTHQRAGIISVRVVDKRETIPFNTQAFIL